MVRKRWDSSSRFPHYKLVPQFLATGQEFNTNISEKVYGAGTCGPAGMRIKNYG